jgi:DNA polymerase-3 subunit delta
LRIKSEQLQSHLKRGLVRVYLVSGDEPLQLEECCDAIRAQARANDYNEREIMHAGKDFAWGALAQAAQTLSLFAQRRILEVRIATGKPGDAGSTALCTYAAAPAPDTILLVICPKLDAQTQKSKWFGALEQAGVTVQVWPVSPAEMPAWITRRMIAKGMQVSAEAAALLAERVEGNLLAAAQDIEKLYLLHGTARIDLAAVTQAVNDSARYDMFEFVDTALKGDAPRTARMLTGLHGEGAEPVLLLWALTKELRSLAGMAYDCQNGMSAEQVLVKYRVWDKRKAPVKQALQRHQLASWQNWLRTAARIDRTIKGQHVGNVWDELLQISLEVAGVRLINNEQPSVNL